MLRGTPLTGPENETEINNKGVKQTQMGVKVAQMSENSKCLQDYQIYFFEKQFLHNVSMGITFKESMFDFKHHLL